MRASFRPPTSPVEIGALLRVEVVWLLRLFLRALPLRLWFVLLVKRFLGRGVLQRSSPASPDSSHLSLSHPESGTRADNMW
jgi:hypothetical protein